MLLRHPCAEGGIVCVLMRHVAVPMLAREIEQLWRAGSCRNFHDFANSLPAAAHHERVDREHTDPGSRQPYPFAPPHQLFISQGHQDVLNVLSSLATLG